MSSTDIDELDSDSDIMPVGQMIQSVSDQPAAARKFLVTNPTIIAKQLLKDKEKKKCKQRMEDNQDTTSTKKHKACKTKPANVDSDNDNDKNVPFKVYVTILKPPLPTSNRKPVRKPVSEKDDDFVQRSPFKLNTMDSYLYFLPKLAEALPYRIDNIHQSKMKWKPQKPTNSKLLPVGGEDGYEAIQDAMREKTKERVIFINMPAPAAPMDEPNVLTGIQAWDTGVEQKPAPTFDYSELEREESLSLFQQQKTTFNDAIKSEKEKLEDEYPIGNCPLFPHLSVLVSITTQKQTTILILPQRGWECG
ncbi:hypothetical protein DFH07DRAFT_781026 [Mycena maculata]|uniref:Uncharacterized protein n=1 Tax=Mycena maculata TaxID=230809 RepID=A0AAD7I1V2_9AGAR|nr:hypothetical protein DFH07DRAFT_781026 [Mycena maculata]